MMQNSKSNLIKKTIISMTAPTGWLERVLWCSAWRRKSMKAWQIPKLRRWSWEQGQSRWLMFLNRILWRRGLTQRELKRFAENPPWVYSWGSIHAYTWEILPQFLSLSFFQGRRVSVQWKSKLFSEKTRVAFKTTGAWRRGRESIDQLGLSITFSLTKL